MAFYKLGTVFSTGLLATTLLLGGCPTTTPQSNVGTPGPAGPAGPAGPGATPDRGGLVSSSSATFCTQFEFEVDDDIAQAQRKAVVTVITDEGEEIARFENSPEQADEEGCFDVPVWDGQLNLVTISSTATGDEPIEILVDTTDGAAGDLEF